MTCIIGGKCKDGVVLVADKKITNEATHQDEYKEKLFIFKRDNFYYPIVVGSSGTVGLYDKFKTEAIETLEEIKSPGCDFNGFDEGFDITVSGIIYPYSSGVNNMSKEVILDPYLERLEDIIKKYKKRYVGERFDVLFAAQVKFKGAVLRYISESGLSEDMDKYKVIGSEIAASVFLKAINPNAMPMTEFAKWGFLSLDI